MGLQRREFLQKASLLLAALGISETQWWLGSNRYYQALAQPTRRKLALLVGINEYPDGRGGFEPLQGCITDIELQRELLTCRFGFQDSDIIMLRDQQATRENIENAFITHLSEQAKPGDVVVFHFSGYGTYIPWLNSNTSSAQGYNALVPVDGTPATVEDGEINDLLEDTLWLLLRSLPTQQIVTVLDTSFAYPGVSQQGAFQIRSSASPNTSQLSSAELTFQDQLLSQLNLSREQLEKRRPNQFPGTLLSATKPSEVAVEIDWDNWSAGLFTHTLTQTLWSVISTDTLQSRFTQVAGVVEQTMGISQQPQLYQELPQNTESRQTNEPLTLKNLLANAGAAEGVITAVEENGKTAKFLFTGVPAPILELTQANSLYTVVPESESEGNPILSQLLIRSRTGLRAKATVRGLGSISSTLPELKTGQRLKEAIRVLPRQIELKVALDPKLTRIERVDATSAISGISDVSIVINDQPADYLLGRVRDTTIAQSPSAPMLSLFQGRYGLFSMGQALLPESAGEGGEAVKSAVQRLVPQLKTRLAAKLLKLTQNQQSSLMKAKTTFALLTPQAKALMSWKTEQSQTEKNSIQPELENISSTTTTSSSVMASVSQGIVSVPEGSRVQYQLQNRGSLPLYFIWFHLDTRGQAYLLDPILEDVEVDEELGKIPRQQRVAPGKIRSLPPTPSFEGTPSTEMIGQMVQGPEGLAETYLVVTHYPFTETLKVIDKNNQRERSNLKLILLSNPLEIAEAVLEDLNRASKPGVERAGISTDDLALDINAWATFNFIYRVV